MLFLSTSAIYVAYELGGIKFPYSFMIIDKIMQRNLIRISFRFAVVKPVRCVVSVQNTRGYIHINRIDFLYDLFRMIELCGNARRFEQTYII